MSYQVNGNCFSGFSHRTCYTFVYRFILLKIAYRGFTHLDGCRFRYVLGASALYIAVVAVSEFVLVRLLSDINCVYSNTDPALNLGLIAIYLFLSYIVRRKKARFDWQDAPDADKPYERICSISLKQSAEKIIVNDDIFIVYYKQYFCLDLQTADPGEDACDFTLKVSARISGTWQ